jgi:hypothetical protein
MRLFAMDMQTNNNQPKNVEVLFVANWLLSCVD